MNDKSGQFKRLKEAAGQLLALRGNAQKADEQLNDIDRLIEELELYQSELQLSSEELNRTQQKFLEARDKYLDLYEFAPVGYLTLDMVDHIDEANLTASNMLGCTRNKLYKARLIDFIETPDLDKYQMAKKDAFEKIGSVSCEIRLGQRTGNQRYVHINFAPEIDENGEITKIMATLTDITALKDAQFELQRINKFVEGVIETARAPIVVIDSLQNVIFSNRAFLRFSKLLKDQVIGEKIYRIGDGLWNIPEFNNLIERVLRDEEIFEDYEIDHEFAGIGRRVILVSARPLRESEYAAMKASISVTDITELRRNREILQKQTETLELKNQELDRVNRELETFTYTASHDLRAPLRSLGGFTQILLEEYADKLDKKGQGYLKRIARASRAMDDLVDGLLQLSRIDQSELNHLRFDLSKLVRIAVRKYMNDQNKGNIEWRIAPGMEITGDEVLLGAVVDNLVNNAIKFTRRAANPKIEIGESNDNGKKVFYVRDNGVGFDMKYADGLFAPFKRLHDPEEYPGTGIGLATVKRIIKRHNGEIWVESEPGKGTTFYFTLGDTEKEKT